MFFPLRKLGFASMRDLMIRLFAKVLSLIPFGLGVTLLAFGVVRYRLPYEDGRYFDAKTNVVYHAQTAELLVVLGTVLTLAGLVIAIGGFRFLRHRNITSGS